MEGIVTNRRLNLEMERQMGKEKRYLPRAKTENNQ